MQIPLVSSVINWALPKDAEGNVVPLKSSQKVALAATAAFAIADAVSAIRYSYVPVRSMLWVASSSLFMTSAVLAETKTRAVSMALLMLLTPRNLIRLGILSPWSWHG